MKIGKHWEKSEKHVKLWKCYTPFSPALPFCQKDIYNMTVESSGGVEYVIFGMGNYYVYIITNPGKTVLYVGVTSDLVRRMYEHYENRGKPTTFAGKYYCHKLIYFERYALMGHAIDREKELKGWTREKKEALINQENPLWHFYDVTKL